MNTKNFKQLIKVVALVAVVSSFASCNRGVGCPSNFSVEKSVVATTVNLVKNLATAILNK